ncbi:MAG: type VI secretion system protein TssA [Gammaproteobacteria bacterium]|nr:type VI secretion system protein TssA [Gammaproteobacteria bacterium]
MYLTDENIARLLEPFPGDDPAGQDVRDDEQYTIVQTEIDKIIGMGDESPDWRTIHKVSKDLLEERSKDVNLVNYLVLAMVSELKLSGLSTGLVLLSNFHKSFGQTCFPKRSRAREASVQWIEERLGNLPALTDLKSISQKQMDEITAGFELYANTMAEVYGNNYQTHAGIKRYIRDYLARILSRPASSGAKISEAKEIQVKKDIETASDLSKALAQIREWNLNIVKYQHKQAGLSAEAAKRLRSAVWDGIESLPQHTNSRTTVQPVNVVQAQEVRKLSPDPKNLVRLEVMLMANPFWLDLNRLVYEMCGQLGDKFTAIAQEVAQTSSAFLKRLPGIEDLQFSDLTPFADTKTREWLGSISQANELRSGIEVSVKDSDSRWRRLNSALSLLQQDGRIEKVIEIVDQQMARRVDAEDKYRLWNIAAKLLYRQGRYLLAMNCIQELEKLVERYRLREWNSSMAKEVYELKYKINHKLYARNSSDVHRAELSGINQSMVGVSLLSAYKNDLEFENN